MANSPIISAAEISDLKNRLASLEAALGRYNATSAVLAASNLQAGQGNAVNIPSDSSGQAVDILNTITWVGNAYKVGDPVIPAGKTYAIVDATIDYSAAKFPIEPFVVVTPRVLDKSGGKVNASASINKPTTTGVSVRIYLPTPPSTGLSLLNLDYIAVGSKSQ